MDRASDVPSASDPTTAVGPSARDVVEELISAPCPVDLAVSPDGSCAVVTTRVIAPDRLTFRTELWRFDLSAAGAAPTVLVPGWTASHPRFLTDGALLFIATAPDADAEAIPDIWRLDAGSVDPVGLGASLPGLCTFAPARCAPRVAMLAELHPGAASTEDDARLMRQRTEAGVTGRLYRSHPVRFWNHYLGPRTRRLLVADIDTSSRLLGPAVHLTAAEDRWFVDEVTSFDILPDGSALVVGFRHDSEPFDPRVDLVRIDAESGSLEVLLEGPADHSSIRCSPEGTRVACIRHDRSARDSYGRLDVIVLDLRTAEVLEVTSQLDLFPRGLTWSPDGEALFITADAHGSVALLEVSLGTGRARQLGDGSWSCPVVAADGRRVYGVRSTITEPPAVSWVSTADGSRAPVGVPVPDPGALGAFAARAERVIVSTDSGQTIESWLILPRSGGSAPLVVVAHGGPVASWSEWSWRWCPAVFAAAGWAVLMPDPPLSTGYGWDFIESGRTRWGIEPYEAVLAAVDATCRRDDVNGARVALVGGSFGGYMANWCATHTDRFACIVSHSGLWNLEVLHDTADTQHWWRREFGDPRVDDSVYRANSPHRHAARLRTPMLVTHGELDYRVPVTQAIALWAALMEQHVDALFLHFPDEGHWVTKPGNFRIWWATVLAFLEHHLEGRDLRLPSLL